MSDSQYYDFDFIEYQYSKIKNFPVKTSGLSAYLAVLPITKFEVSLGEGSTPLTMATRLGERYHFSNLWIKHEELNPIGCFKDRESAVVVSKAIQEGHQSIYVVSSGNAALSTAAYANKVGLKCSCYVPKSTSLGKKRLITLFGAEITEIEGNYEQVYRQVFDNPPAGWNVTPGANPYRIEGNKTIAYEIWQELGVPDVVVVPCGNGGNLAGIWRGFWELQQLGLTTKMPRFMGVQVHGAAPLKLALQSNKDFSIAQNIPDSIAEGIIAEESYCSPKALRALKDSHGQVVEVTEAAIKSALKEAVQCESLVTEPTSAAVFAALPQLGEYGVKPDAQIVLINTGSGMKNLEEIVDLIA